MLQESPAKPVFICVDLCSSVVQMNCSGCGRWRTVRARTAWQRQKLVNSAAKAARAPESVFHPAMAGDQCRENA